MKDLNRIKVVLVEKKRTAKWLGEELERNSATGCRSFAMGTYTPTNAEVW